MQKLLIITVNYCTPHLVINMVDSLRGLCLDNVDLRVDIVDNKSPDESVEIINNWLVATTLKHLKTF